jgi:curved DNA-binding protein CbpA
MSLCPCGNTAEEKSALCARCAALQTLELPLSANKGEIKAAYHLLVKVWHPDRFQTDEKLKDAAEEKFKAITAAYRTLTSGPQKRARGRQSHASSETATPATPPVEAPAASTQSQATATVGTKGPGLRSYAATFAALGMAQRLLVLGCGIGVSGLFAKYIDYQLAADPTTARVYADMKISMAKEVEEPKRRFFDGLEQSLHSLNPFKTAAASATVPAAASVSNLPVSQPAVTPRIAVNRSIKKAQPALIPLTPYITVGLTKDEVLAAAGSPTADTGDKLVYNGSELYLKNGKVAGWKIDPSTAPLHVKLWPDAPVDTELRFFVVGSTKNDVLEVQGTPTLLASDKFGYGASEVYFKNNRVVSWKNDPASVPLRAMAR